MNVNIMHKNKLKEYRLISKADVETGDVALYQKDNTYIVCRHAHRGNITNVIHKYELVQAKTSNFSNIDLEHGQEIIRRIGQGMPFSDALIFNHGDVSPTLMTHKPSELEHKFTSTGIKFWRHQEQMMNYRNGNPNTIISTHISPEGACNLKCSYCSVTYRDTHSRIPLDTIKDYVTKLKSRGLRAVILTGGGEPTLYREFNELVRWLYANKLDIGLVTNGTVNCWRHVDADVCKMFTWVRVSINIFDGWESRIALPLEKFDTTQTTIGCSMVYTIENNKDRFNNIEFLNKISAVADRCGAQYIRMLPNCLLGQKNLLNQHSLLNELLSKASDPRFFHQYKIHGTPQSTVCHQSYFRPYLSEEIHKGTGLPGTVYPCDSVVLNEGKQFYSQEYQLCHASEILNYLDKNIKHQFNPQKKCQGCVHTRNVNMLQEWIDGTTDRFEEFSNPLTHENFI